MVGFRLTCAESDDATTGLSKYLQELVPERSINLSLLMGPLAPEMT
jgi:hypothetical protein